MWKILLLIPTFSSALFCGAQTIEQCIAYSGLLTEQNRYEEAAELYERAIFFADRSDSYRSKTEKGNLYFLLGNTYTNMKEYDLAIDNYKLASEHADKCDSIYFEILFAQVMCSILKKDLHYALMNTLDFTDTTEEYFYQKKQFYLAVIYFKLNEISASEKYFIQLINNSDTLSIERIFLNLKNTAARINPRKAKTLSRILPGAGQLYNKDYPGAVNSFLLNSAIISAAVLFAYQYTVIDAVLFTGNFFLRYYVGGFQKAKLFADNKLAALRENAFGELMDLVEKNRIFDKKY